MVLSHPRVYVVLGFAFLGGTFPGWWSHQSEIGTAWMIDARVKETSDLDSQGVAQVPFRFRNVSSQPMRVLGASFC